MSQSELVRQVVEALDRLKIPYMITGCIASSLQGEPRATHKIDLVISLESAKIDQLVRTFPPPDFYLDRDSMMKAIETEGMFNLIHIPEGDKVDFWMLTDEPFDRSRFARRRKETALGKEMIVSAPEDTILAKLRRARFLGGSEKQFTDALRVFEVQYPNLDLQYLESWAEDLSVTELWRRLNEQAEMLN